MTIETVVKAKDMFDSLGGGDESERRWYRNGAENKWLSDFPFARRKVYSTAIQNGQTDSLLEQYIGNSQ